MFGDSNAAQVNHYVCIDDAASRHSADLLGGILTVRGGPAATARWLRQEGLVGKSEWLQPTLNL